MDGGLLLESAHVMNCGWLAGWLAYDGVVDEALHLVEVLEDEAVHVLHVRLLLAELHKVREALDGLGHESQGSCCVLWRMFYSPEGGVGSGERD